MGGRCVAGMIGVPKAPNPPGGLKQEERLLHPSYHARVPKAPNPPGGLKHPERGIAPRRPTLVPKAPNPPGGLKLARAGLSLEAMLFRKPQIRPAD